MTKPTTGFSLRLSDPLTIKHHRRRGFHITFTNMYTVSVQYGQQNYCDEYGEQPKTTDTYLSWSEANCVNAEVAIIDPDGELVCFDLNQDTVRGHTTPDDLAKIMAWTVALPPKVKV